MWGRFWAWLSDYPHSPPHEDQMTQPPPIILTDETQVRNSLKALTTGLAFLSQTVKFMDAQVVALQGNISALSTILTTFFADVTTALANQSTAIDADDEAAITASNQALTDLVSSVQTQIAKLPVASGPIVPPPAAP
jgi:hypothetical protein